MKLTAEQFNWDFKNKNNNAYLNKLSAFIYTGNEIKVDEEDKMKQKINNYKTPIIDPELSPD